MSNEVLNLAVKMSISSAKRMGDVATAYDTKSKKVITHSVKKKINSVPKNKRTRVLI